MSEHVDEKLAKTDTDLSEGNPGGLRGGLEDYETSGEGRPPFILTTTELKLLGIAGVGFFLDG